MDVIFICSMAHSGSTFLELFLTRHNEFVGLGELGHTLEVLCKGDSYHEDSEYEFDLCTCLKPKEECEFWGSIIDDLTQVSTQEGHRIVLDRFQDKYPDKILVDSTKDIKYIDRHYEGPSQDQIDSLKVLYLFRDFRSWVESSLERENSRNNLITATYGWLRKNFKNRLTLKNKRIDFKTISYEKLVFETKNHFKTLLQFTESSSVKVPSINNDTESHGLMGNQMRLNAEKRSRIVYDYEWFKSSGYWLFQPLLLPGYLYNQYLYRNSRS